MGALAARRDCAVENSWSSPSSLPAWLNERCYVEKIQPRLRTIKVREIAEETYGEVLRSYEFHLGAKIADAKGKPSGKQSFGLLRRRHVRVERIIYIGKESNRLEEIEAGIIHSPESVYTEYPDPRREEWQTRILPVLKKIPIACS